MTVKQISVFLENKPGKLAEFTDVLSDNKIDMRALSLAEAADFGIARVIVDDVYNASTVLKDAGYGDLVIETVNPGSLSAFVKEQILENENELPSWLDGLVNVFEKNTVSTRKYKK